MYTVLHLIMVGVMEPVGAIDGMLGGDFWVYLELGTRQ